MEPSFTSFPEGEGATNPDIPSEPMLNKLYNKVLSLTTSGKSPTPTPTVQQQPPPPPLAPMPVVAATESSAPPPPSESTTGLGISLGGTHQSRNPSVTSISGTGDANFSSTSNPPPPQLEKIDIISNRQAMVKSAEKSPDVLEPILSPVNAIGGLTRSEDGASVGGSDKPSEPVKQPTNAQLREINLPGLAGFRLTREPSSDSESIASSFGVHPSRTVDRIIGRLKTGDLGREFWMKDESSHECFLCGEKFTSSTI